MKDKAKTWYDVEERKPDFSTMTWDIFVTKLKNKFDSARRRVMLEQRLQTKELRRGDRLDDYFSEMLKLIAETNPQMKQDSQIALLHRSIKSFTELYRAMAGTWAKTVDEWIRVAKEQNTAIRNARVAKKSNAFELRLSDKSTDKTPAATKPQQQNRFRSTRPPSTCHYCQKPGHLMRQCRKLTEDKRNRRVKWPERKPQNFKPREKSENVEVVSYDTSPIEWNDEVVFQIKTEYTRLVDDTRQENKRHFLPLAIRDKNQLVVKRFLMDQPLKILVDTGSTRTLVNYKLFKLTFGRYFTKRIKPAPDINLRLLTATNERVPIKGIIPVSISDQTGIVDAVVADKLGTDCHMILGNDFLMAAKAQIDFANGKLHVANIKEENNNTPADRMKIETDLSFETKNRLKDTINTYDDVFAYDGCKPGLLKGIEHRIVLKEGSEPIRCRPYRVSEAYQKHIDEQIEKMLRDNIIEPVRDSDWAFPVLLVPKKDGRLRFCVDFRKLNQLTKRDLHPLPNIDDLSLRFAGRKYFSLIDLEAAYWQVPVRESDRNYTTFVTQRGCYRHVRMAFGLMNAPSTFQRAMEQVLQPVMQKGVVVYLDDIVVATHDLDEHIVLVGETFQCLETAGAKVRPEKTKLLANEAEILGHVFSQDGVKPAMSKVVALKNFKTPANPKELASFLGLANYERRYIKDFAKISAPLRKLQKKDAEYKWEEEQQNAFDKLREALTTYPTLALYNPQLPSTIVTDASLSGLGCVLKQPEGDGHLKTVCYASRSLNSAEQNYSIIDLELLAVVFAFDQWKHYLAGSPLPITIITDSMALSWLLSHTKPFKKQRMARWFLALQGYDVRVQHRPGSVNAQADCLSRFPVLPPAKDDTDLAVPTYSIQESNEADLFCDIHDVKIHQLLDPLCKEIRNNNLPMLKPIEIDGVLYVERWQEGENRTVLVVPETDFEDIFKAYHNNPIHGHVGFKKTLEKLRQRFYIPQLPKKLNKFIQRCYNCQISNPRVGKLPGNLMPIPIPGAWERVALDVVGPLPPSHNNKYIIVAIDYASRYVEAKALPAQTAKATAEFIVDQIILRHSAPRIFYSDNGVNFVLKTMEELSKLLNVDQKTTTKYHPQSAGLVERTNRTIVSILRRYVTEKQDNWADILKFAIAAYNFSYQSSIGMSPFKFLYGREPVFPSDIALGSTIKPGVPTKRQREIYQAVAKYMAEERQEASKIWFNNRRRPDNYMIGDYVLYNAPPALDTKTQATKKLAPKWVGPYEVKSRKARNTFVLSSLIKGYPDITASIENIKLYYHEDSEDEEENYDDNETNAEKENVPENNQDKVGSGEIPEIESEVVNKDITEPTVDKEAVTDNMSDNDEKEEYEVENILRKRTRNGQTEYYIKWKGYTNKYNQWLPISDMGGCQELIEEFEAKEQRRAKGHGRRKYNRLYPVNNYISILFTILAIIPMFTLALKSELCDCRNAVHVGSYNLKPKCHQYTPMKRLSQGFTYAIIPSPNATRRIHAFECRVMDVMVITECGFFPGPCPVKRIDTHVKVSIQECKDMINNHICQTEDVSYRMKRYGQQWVYDIPPQPEYKWFKKTISVRRNCWISQMTLQSDCATCRLFNHEHALSVGIHDGGEVRSYQTFTWEVLSDVPRERCQGIPIIYGRASLYYRLYYMPQEYQNNNPTGSETGHRLYWIRDKTKRADYVIKDIITDKSPCLPGFTLLTVVNDETLFIAIRDVTMYKKPFHSIPRLRLSQLTTAPDNRKWPHVNKRVKRSLFSPIDAIDIDLISRQQFIGDSKEEDLTKIDQHLYTMTCVVNHILSARLATIGDSLEAGRLARLPKCMALISHGSIGYTYDCPRINCTIGYRNTTCGIQPTCITPHEKHPLDIHTDGRQITREVECNTQPLQTTFININEKIYALINSKTNPVTWKEIQPPLLFHDAHQLMSHHNAIPRIVKRFANTTIPGNATDYHDIEEKPVQYDSHHVNPTALSAILSSQDQSSWHDKFDFGVGHLPTLIGTPIIILIITACLIGCIYTFGCGILIACLKGTFRCCCIRPFQTLFRCMQRRRTRRLNSEEITKMVETKVTYTTVPARGDDDVLSLEDGADTKTVTFTPDIAKEKEDSDGSSSSGPL